MYFIYCKLAKIWTQHQQFLKYIVSFLEHLQIIFSNYFL